MDLTNEAPAYVLMLKIGYEKADIVVGLKGGEPLGGNHHGYGARHHYHDSSWLGVKKVGPKQAHPKHLLKL